LISLSAIRRLDLLRILYGRIFIPPAVHHEVVTQGPGRPGAAEVASADWIERRMIANPGRLPPLPSALGNGERETIILADELSVDLVIMDDPAGRRELIHRTIRFIGTAGVLQQAKLRNLLAAVKPELDALRRSGFHLSERVYRACLAAVGE
jgi:uncharacterized protein